MRWSRLKNNACPHCASRLIENKKDLVKECSDASCHFRISFDKFILEINKLYKPTSHKIRIRTEEQNLNDLNNL